MTIVTPGSEQLAKAAAQKAAAEKQKPVKGKGKGAMQNPDVDIVIPISGTMYIDHLRNCLAALRRQTFPQEDMGVIVSCVAHEAVDVAALGELCQQHEAALVFTKPRHKHFSRGFALNVGARYGSRRMIALLDADVVLHPSTIQIAVHQCLGAVMAIIPVVRTQHGPNAPFWKPGNMKNVSWPDLTKGLKYERGGFGNSVVQRSAFVKMHGHDERFFGWGGIDTDLYYRMLKSGRVINLEDIGHPRALHQHHPPPPSKRDPGMTKRNRELLHGSKSIVRNPKRWGTIRCR